MLRLTFVLFAVLFATEATGGTSDLTHQSMAEAYLHQIRSSLLKTAESVFNSSSIPSEISSKLNDETSILSDRLDVAFVRLKSRIKVLNSANASADIPTCMKLLNRREGYVKKILHQIYTCSATKIGMYYIQNPYNDIMGQIEVCKEKIDPNDHLSTNQCYYKAKSRVQNSLKTSDDIKSKMINPDESYINRVFAECKAANRFETMQIEMEGLTRGIDGCINFSARKTNLEYWINTVLSPYGYFICNVLTEISSCKTLQ